MSEMREVRGHVIAWPPDGPIFTVDTRRGWAGDIPVILRTYDPSDPPPDWPEGTRVHSRALDVILTVGPGDIHRDFCGRWRFWSGKVPYRCSDFEPVPTTESVTLRGEPEHLRRIREIARSSGVEVVEDE